MRSVTAATCRSSSTKRAAPTMPPMSATRWKAASTTTTRSGRRRSTPSPGASVDAAGVTAEHIRKIGRNGARIGIEPGFMPSDAHAVLAGLGNQMELVDATGTLERLRAVKTPAELAKLRTASELITDSMLATIGWAGEGTTKSEIIERIRQEETSRGLHFDYCLVTLGASHNRAGSPQPWQPRRGAVDRFRRQLPRLHRRSLPHGRAGRAGFRAARTCCRRSRRCSRRRSPGSRPARCGGDFIAACRKRAEVARPTRACNDFFAHGMGLISHEAPFLMTNHPVAYEGSRRGQAARGRHGAVGGDDDAPSRPAASSSSRTRSR